jgi:glycosyltransferase involved in cell wall biosynthesis
MKILLMTSLWGQFGGKEQYVQCCVEELTRMGHECSVAYGRASARSKDSNLPLIPHYQLAAYSDISSPGDGLAEAQLAEILRAEAPDVIFMCDVRNLRLLKMLKSYGGLVAMSHDHWLVCQRGTCTSYFREAICDRACGYCRVRHALINHGAVLESYRDMDIHIVASRDMKRRLVQNGFRPDSIRVLGLFTDLQPAERASMDQEAQVPTVTFAGRVDRPKGVHYLLRALARLSIPFRCTVIGDGEHLPYCKALSGKLGVDARVNFTGWLPRATLGSHLAASSVVVVPSVWPEPFGLVGLEAMACAKPVVAFDTGGISDWLQDGVNGYLVPVKNIGLLAERIGSLLQDPGKGELMGDAGFEMVKSRFSRERHFEELLSTFEQVRRTGPSGSATQIAVAATRLSIRGPQSDRLQAVI